MIMSSPVNRRTGGRPDRHVQREVCCGSSSRKAASRAELSACAVAAARNAQELLYDAEVLAGCGSRARAYSLAVLAVEESGKAAGLTAIAGLPDGMRTHAAAGRLLQWHQLKLGGLPLALEQAASYMRATATALAGYLAGRERHDHRARHYSEGHHEG
jgi:AbiV family abortive infection protein